jgi:hypothetical protein
MVADLAIVHTDLQRRERAAEALVVVDDRIDAGLVSVANLAIAGSV